MNFDLSEEQKILKKSAHDFLAKECPKEKVRQIEEGDLGYSEDLWRKMADLGWMGLIIPENHGGIGGSFLDLTILLEEMGYNICPGPFISTVVLGSLPILLAGSEAQKAEFLPQIASGEKIITLALSEADAGYEAAAIKVTARPDADGYTIDGTKLFVPYAHVADYIILVARIRESADPKQGISLFVLDAKSAGITCSLLKTLGGDKQCELVFDGVHVPGENILGNLDAGWKVVEDTLQKAAIATSAEMIGGAQAVMDLALQYARERTQFNHPIGSFQAIQHHFANMWADINGSRNLLYKTAWKINQGLNADIDIAMTKARVGKTYRRVTILGHQIFGGIGFTMEHDMHLYHKRSIVGDLTFGSSDFHYDKIARQLGL